MIAFPTNNPLCALTHSDKYQSMLRRPGYACVQVTVFLGVTAVYTVVGSVILLLLTQVGCAYVDQSVSMSQLHVSHANYAQSTSGSAPPGMRGCVVGHGLGVKNKHFTHS